MSTDVTIMKTLVRQDQVTGSGPLEETFRVEKKKDIVKVAWKTSFDWEI